jgi:hypothetical protein
MNLRSLKPVIETVRLAWKHIVLAGLLVVLGLIVLPHGKASAEWIDEGRRAIAGALFATGLVSLLYDYLFVRRVIGNYFELLKTAASLELDQLYADRSQALKDIATELQGASGRVKVICVSGSDFFEEGPVAEAISNLIERRHNAHLRFLLLKPTNRYAFLRSWVEEKYGGTQEDQEKLDEGKLGPEDYTRDDFRISAMQARIDMAQAAIRNMSQKIQSPTKLSVRLYVYQPSVFMVAVNRWVFVETYHWGVDRYYIPHAVQPCIAKRVPVLKFRRNSFNGMIFENHFDRVWRCSQTERLFPPSDPEPTTTSKA